MTDMTVPSMVDMHFVTFIIPKEKPKVYRRARPELYYVINVAMMSNVFFLSIHDDIIFYLTFPDV
jgi:hypothetical protein